MRGDAGPSAPIEFRHKTPIAASQPPLPRGITIEAIAAIDRDQMVCQIFARLTCVPSVACNCIRELYQPIYSLKPAIFQISARSASWSDREVCRTWGCTFPPDATQHATLRF